MESFLPSVTSTEKLHQLSFSALTLMILTTSFLGSWHCVGMCSPIASIAANKKQLTGYHLGRITSYVSLGALSGWMGSFFLGSQFKWIQSLSIIFLSITLIAMGFLSLRNQDVLAKIKFHKTMTFIFQLQKKLNLTSGYWLGLFTGFFPCGWLYTFLLAAVASKSTYAGALILFLFTLGSIPALSAISLMVQRNILLSNEKKRKLAGIILLLAGLYSLISHFVFGFHYADELFR